MKKIMYVLISIALSFSFTACGMAAANAARDFSQFENEGIYFDISEHTELLSAMEDENATVTFGRISFNPLDIGFTVQYTNGSPAKYYTADLENQTLEEIEFKSLETEHGAVDSFVYNGKPYWVTMDTNLTDNSSCCYLESEDGIVTLTENGVQEFSTQYYCENGYVVMRKESEQAGMMHYRVYSVEKGDFIIDENIPYTEFRDTVNYDVLNWLDGDRYMHFDTVTGQIIDVTEDFHAVDDNNIGGNTPTEKMLDYRYVWNKTFYEIAEDMGVHFYTMNSGVPYVNYIDKVNYTLYQKPHLSEDGERLVLIKFIMKERDR